MIDKLIQFGGRILGIEVKSEGQDFVKSASWVAGGLLISKVFTSIMLIYSGNVLSQTDYGYYALALSIAMVIQVFMRFGLDTAMVRFASRSKKHKDRFFSTAYILVFCFTIITGLAYFFLLDPLSDLFDIRKQVMLIALPLGVAMTWFLLLEITLQGLGKMKWIAAVRILYTSIALLGSMIFIQFRNDYTGLGLGVILGAFAGIILGAFASFKDYRPKPGTDIGKTAGELLKFGSFGTIAAFSTTILYFFDKILIGYFLSAQDVGAYFAYSLAATGGIGVVLYGVVIAMFPRVSSKSVKQKREILVSINKIFLRMLIPVFGLIFLGQVVVLLLMNQYELRLDWLILFSIYGIFYMTTSVYSWFASSDKKIGIRSVGLTSFFSAVLFVIIVVAGLHRSGVGGIIFAGIIALAFASMSYVLFCSFITKPKKTT